MSSSTHKKLPRTASDLELLDSLSGRDVREVQNRIYPPSFIRANRGLFSDRNWINIAELRLFLHQRSLWNSAQQTTATLIKAEPSSNFLVSLPPDQVKLEPDPLNVSRKPPTPYAATPPPPVRTMRTTQPASSTRCIDIEMGGVDDGRESERGFTLTSTTRKEAIREDTTTTTKMDKETRLVVGGYKGKAVRSWHQLPAEVIRLVSVHSFSFLCFCLLALPAFGIGDEAHKTGVCAGVFSPSAQGDATLDSHSRFRFHFSRTTLPLYSLLSVAALVMVFPSRVMPFRSRYAVPLEPCLISPSRDRVAFLEAHVDDYVFNCLLRFPYLETSEEIAVYRNFCQASMNPKVQSWWAHKISYPWLLPSLKRSLTQMSHLHWDLTPGDTNLIEGSHVQDNQVNHTNLMILEAVLSARVYDQETARIIAASEA
ncbi:hypothetical protein C8R45DRAFT_1214268 [Mycena sanguinolenta]|nr:hypothetical protein C8R45DRAFT_1214268 [Mycena sanguinolenta]